MHVRTSYTLNSPVTIANPLLIYYIPFKGRSDIQFINVSIIKAISE